MDINTLFVLPSETLRKYEFFVLLPGKKGKGRRLETQAYTPEQAIARGELAAERKFQISAKELRIKNVTAIGEVSELVAA